MHLRMWYFTWLSSNQLPEFLHSDAERRHQQLLPYRPNKLQCCRIRWMHFVLWDSYTVTQD